MLLFLITSFFTTSLSLLKSTVTGTELSTSNLSTLLFKLLDLVGTFLNLSITLSALDLSINVSALDFKLAKPNFLAIFYLSTSLAFFKSAFVV